MRWHRKFLVTTIFCLVTAWICHAQNDSKISFLALGDSYTIGESVSEDQRWPVQLADSLQKRGIKIKEPHIIAKTGWTTDELINAVQQKNPARNYDLVSLLIGVNNQYRGYDISSYKTEFEQLLKQAISFAGGKPNRLFVVSIPDYGATPFGQEKNPGEIAKELNQYNSIARNICNKYQVSFINITPYSKKALKDPSLTADDDLHPSAKMYQQWVSKIIPVVLDKL